VARADRAAVAPVVSTTEARGAVEAVWRMESARIVGALARYTGDFSLAEDIAQEALAEALVSWSVDGVPAQPTGWLLTVGRRRAIDTPSGGGPRATHGLQCWQGISTQRLPVRTPCSNPTPSMTTCSR